MGRRRDSDQDVEKLLEDDGVEVLGDAHGPPVGDDYLKRRLIQQGVEVTDILLVVSEFRASRK